MIVVSMLCFALSLFNFQVFPQQEKKNLKAMEWLIGTWKRTNTKPGEDAYEKWEKISTKEFSGIGVILKGEDTVFMERLEIVVKNDGLFYIAEVAHNPAPIYFEIKKQEASGFVSSNPDHDFPKQISYHLEGDKLTAKISGNDKSIVFDFLRVK